MGQYDQYPAATALEKFMNELPYMLMQNKMRKDESAAAHERAVELRTLDQVESKHYVYDDDGNVDTKASLGKQQEFNHWAEKGMLTTLGPSAVFSYGKEDVTGGKYTMEDYSRDRSSMRELAMVDDIGYNDALNLIDMGLFELDGDPLLPGGDSREDIATQMAEPEWWISNKAAVNERIEPYFQGVLANPSFTDPEAWSTYKANEQTTRLGLAESKLADPNYITNKEAVNQLFDVAGVWKNKFRFTDTESGETSYFNPNTGETMSADDFISEFPAIAQLMDSALPLEWVASHYKEGGKNNKVIKQLLEDSPSFTENYVLPLLGKLDQINAVENQVTQEIAAAGRFTDPTYLPPELETVLSAFEESDAPPVPLPSNEEVEKRKAHLISIGADPVYLNIVMGPAVSNGRTDEEILDSYPAWAFQGFSPQRNENWMEDLYNMNDDDLRETFLTMLTPEETAEYDLYVDQNYTQIGQVSQALTPALPQVPSTAIETARTEYNKELEEYLSDRKTYQDLVELNNELVSERTKLQGRLDELVDLQDKSEFELTELVGLDSASHKVVYGKSMFGEKVGLEMHERIQELNELIENNQNLIGRQTLDETAVVTGDIPHIARREAVLSRREAEEARRSLELLIKDKLDSIPDLYKTDKGQSLF